MTTPVTGTPVETKKHSENLSNGVRKCTKTVAMTNPPSLAILHFANNFANGDTFGQALDNATNQTAQDYKHVAAPVLDAAKKAGKKVAQEAKPKDRVELVAMCIDPQLVIVKRAATALGDYIKKQWNNLPNYAK